MKTPEWLQIGNRVEICVDKGVRGGSRMGRIVKICGRRSVTVQCQVNGYKETKWNVPIYKVTGWIPPGGRKLRMTPLSERNDFNPEVIKQRKEYDRREAQKKARKKEVKSRRK